MKSKKDKPIEWSDIATLDDQVWAVDALHDFYNDPLDVEDEEE